MNWTLIGERLRAKRIQCNLTQEQLAHYAGTSNIYICRIENGTANPTLLKIRKLCEVLGCSLSYLIDGKEVVYHDPNAAHISRLLDGCSPYMVRVITQIVESLVKDKNTDFF